MTEQKWFDVETIPDGGMPICLDTFYYPTTISVVYTGGAFIEIASDTSRQRELRINEVKAWRPISGVTPAVGPWHDGCPPQVVGVKYYCITRPKETPHETFPETLEYITDYGTGIWVNSYGDVSLETEIESWSRVIGGGADG